MRMEKQRKAKTTKGALTPRMTGTRVGGSTKFGWIPGGGCPAGSVFSKAGGMLSMSFGSASADMISASEMLWHEKNHFGKERITRMDINFPWQSRVGPNVPGIALP